MAYNTIKKKYSEHAKQVKKVNDVFSGSDYAANYLLQYNKEDKVDFDKRKDAATLDNFVFRTLDTMKNIVFRKDIDTTGVVNKDMLKYIETIDLQNSIDFFAKQIFENARKDGFTFILADSQNYDKTLLVTKADRERAKIRPYLVNIKREQVINWQGSDINFSEWVIIRETVIVDGDNFEEEEIQQYRVIYKDGTVFIYKDDGTEEILQTVPKDKILIKVGIRDIPELYDQALINIKHLNRDSELDNYVRIGGAPFLGVGGQRNKRDGAVETIAINKGLQFESEKWKVEWIEMSGQNAIMIENRISKYEESMLRYSIEFLTKDGNLTATQVNKESTPKESKLKGYAKQLEESLNEALEQMGLYIKSGYGENLIIVNKDFDNSLLLPEEADGYRQDFINGVISLDTLWKLYEKGERLPIRTEQEKEEEKALVRETQIE